MVEAHKGVCGHHQGGRSLAAKVLRVGYYWLTMKADCMKYVERCEKCQRFAQMHLAPPEELHCSNCTWPFVDREWISLVHFSKLLDKRSISSLQLIILQNG